MRKLKYVLASIALAVGFASCETEPVDGYVKDTSLGGKPLFSFDLNAKQKVVSNDVSVGFPTGGMTITAKLSILDEEDTSNPETRYKPAYLYVNFNSLVVGNFPTSMSNLLSSASITIQELVPDENDVIQKVWYTYSTANADESQNAGYANITYVNSTAKYLNGNFDFTLYPPAEEPELMPQKLTNGTFSYLNY
ncbi:hypothetical protein P3875_04735 [Myroides sp. JBRI-B21084]|uniref:hypothetical protein n=1 Tax=Myroides sp. JBRI-B21084 TaxID=3119977 RepID=UPI0026E16200|nr:hypothetical protein [Paenimyroides cloacae]WKW47370.1 hypothetical protein P3875_04735 [Paenimyroides cloacae]